jgi:hypothetical protein
MTYEHRYISRKNHEDLLAAIIGYELLLALVVMFFIHYVENLARKQTRAVCPLFLEVAANIYCNALEKERWGNGAVGVHHDGLLSIRGATEEDSIPGLELNLTAQICIAV